MNKEKQAYEEVISLLKKHKDILAIDVNRIESIAENHLLGLELKEKYGFNIDPRSIKSLDWNRLGEYIGVGMWGKSSRRTISWPDDGRQPADEMLLEISFSTGAYIFSDDYPVKIFQDFFQELKTYNPKYTDSTNKCLYFSMENAGKIFNEFNNILKKYCELNREDAKKRKMKKLQDELDKLQKESK